MQCLIEFLGLRGFPFSPPEQGLKSEGGDLLCALPLWCVHVCFFIKSAH